MSALYPPEPPYCDYCEKGRPPGVGPGYRKGCPRHDPSLRVSADTRTPILEARTIAALKDDLNATAGAAVKASHEALRAALVGEREARQRAEQQRDDCEHALYIASEENLADLREAQERALEAQRERDQAELSLRARTQERDEAVRAHTSLTNSYLALGKELAEEADRADDHLMHWKAESEARVGVELVAQQLRGALTEAVDWIVDAVDHGDQTAEACLSRCREALAVEEPAPWPPPHLSRELESPQETEDVS